MANISSTALILIDIQKGLDQLDYYGGHRNNLDAEQNARKILDFFRKKAWPIFHVKHNSIHPESTLRPHQIGNEIKEIVAPLKTEPIIEKNVNSAFIGTNLKNQLDQLSINKLILVGLTTDHCVSTTARMASNLGFQTIVIADATAAFDKISWDQKKLSADLVHEVELACLSQEFAEIQTTDDFLNTLKED